MNWLMSCLLLQLLAVVEQLAVQLTLLCPGGVVGAGVPAPVQIPKAENKLGTLGGSHPVWVVCELMT